MSQHELATGTSLVEQVVVPHQLTGQGILDAAPHPFPHTERVPLIADDHFPRSWSQLGPDIPSHHEFTPIGGIQLDTPPGSQAAVGQRPFVGEAITLLEGFRQLDADAIEAQFALPGLSDSANMSLIYENYGLSMRISYNWRDEFLSGFDQHSAPVFTEAYGQWDFNVNYAVTDNLTVFVEGLNITEETQRTYVRFKEQFLRGYQYGARYNLGVRYTF